MYKYVLLLVIINITFHKLNVKCRAFIAKVSTSQAYYSFSFCIVCSHLIATSNAKKRLEFVAVSLLYHYDYT